MSEQKETQKTAACHKPRNFGNLIFTGFFLVIADMNKRFKISRKAPPIDIYFHFFYIMTKIGLHCLHRKYIFLEFLELWKNLGFYQICNMRRLCLIY